MAKVIKFEKSRAGLPCAASVLNKERRKSDNTF